MIRHDSGRRAAAVAQWFVAVTGAASRVKLFHLTEIMFKTEILDDPSLILTENKVIILTARHFGSIMLFLARCTCHISKRLHDNLSMSFCSMATMCGAAFGDRTPPICSAPCLVLSQLSSRVGKVLRRRAFSTAAFRQSWECIVLAFVDSEFCHVSILPDCPYCQLCSCPSRIEQAAELYSYCVQSGKGSHTTRRTVQSSFVIFAIMQVRAHLEVIRA